MLLLKLAHRRLFKPIPLAIAGGVVMLGTSGTILLANQPNSNRLAEQDRAIANSQDVKQQASNQSSTAEELSQKSTGQQPGQKPVPTTADKSAPKYSTSSDPRSTAYSTTPPAPNPASFEIKITHAGQVPAGTLIMYNATKNEKDYYGGDLVLSASSVTISKSSGNLTAPFTVSTPDGAVANLPALPWDEQSQVAFVATNSGSPLTGSSWNMFVQLFSSSVAVGTYQLHIVTHGTSQADGRQYDGFITVNIVP